MNDLKQTLSYREKKQQLLKAKKSAYDTLNAKRPKLRRIPGTKKRK